MPGFKQRVPKSSGQIRCSLVRFQLICTRTRFFLLIWGGGGKYKDRLNAEYDLRNEVSIIPTSI